jgi:hypothetical protein
MRTIHLTLIASLILIVSACSSVRVNYDFDPGTNFSPWQTFAWYPAESPPVGDPRLDNPLLNERITAAVNRTLAARGYTLVEGRSPDFYINYHLSTEQRLDVRTMNRTYMGGPHRRHWGGSGWSGVGWTETRVDQYEVGTLVIDFVDTGARRLVWRGSGTRRLARNQQADRVTQRVNEAVEEILAQFPPQ